jgi:hypothetical protein
MLMISSRQTFVAGALALLASSALTTGANAAMHTYTYQLFSVANALQTNPVAINNSGVVVGNYVDTSYNSHGFTYQNAKLAPFDVPKAATTTPLGINDRGEIVGNYTDASGTTHGFLRTAAGAYKTIDPAGSLATGLDAISPTGVAVGVSVQSGGTIVFTYKNGVYKTIINGGSAIPVGINAHGSVAGYYEPPHQNETSFLYENGTATTIPISNVTYAQSFGINKHTVVVGQVATTQHQEFGFRYKNGKVKVFGPPSYTDSFFTGVNDLDVIVGAAFTTSGASSGFVYDNGDFSFLNIAGMAGVGGIGINNAGVVIGDYSDNNVAKGFLATPAS